MDHDESDLFIEDEGETWYGIASYACLQNNNMELFR